MTTAMYANLRRLAGNDKEIAEVIRIAIREYMDDKGQITGSRQNTSTEQVISGPCCPTINHTMYV